MSANFQFSVFSFQFSVSVPLAAALLLSTSAPAAEPLTLPVWPAGAPGKLVPRSEATDTFIKKHQSKNTVTDIAEPTITVYRPEKPNGTSVIVAPGGGFMFLSAVHEGTQVCEWLNTLGVTSILLKYRTPTRDEPAAHDKPVQDAQQALKIIRSRATEWNLNPNRVGLLGFSAGGNLLAHLACDRGPQKAELPNFGVMIYGGGFLDPKDPNQLAPNFTVPADAPPMFIACAHDDKTNPIASTLLYLEYKKQNLPAELHLFTHGGHGFGMRDNKQPINQWPARCAEWMNAQKLLPNVAKLEAEIEWRADKLVSIRQMFRLGSPGVLCSYDLGLLAEWRKEVESLPAAQKSNDQERIKDLEHKAKQIEKFDEGQKVLTSAKEDLNVLKKEMAELEAKRAAILGDVH